MTYYKMLNPNRMAPIAPGFQYPPVGGWTPKISADSLSMCVTGYHVVDSPRGVLEHIAPDVFKCDVEGVGERDVYKVLVESVKLGRQVMGAPEWAAFARDCADHVAHLDNARSARYAAARSAARSAAYAADAARSAASAANAAYAAYYAAYYAANAAYDAYDAERAWQDERLAWYLTGEAYDERTGA